MITEVLTDGQPADHRSQTHLRIPRVCLGIAPQIENPTNRSSLERTAVAHQFLLRY